MFNSQKSRFSHFQYLWKTEDKDWMERRKAEWRKLSETLCPKCSAKALKYRQTYFLTGDEPWPKDLKIRFNNTIRFILTPFETEDQARELFACISHASDKSDVANGFMAESCQRAPDMPWLRKKIISFYKGVLGEEYTKMTAFNGPKEVTTSPEPTVFCADFIKGAIRIINNKNTYHFCLDTIPYFVSALPYADNAYFRKMIRMQTFMDEINKIAASAATEPDDIQKFSLEIKQREKEIWNNWLINKHLDAN